MKLGARGLGMGPLRKQPKSIKTNYLGWEKQRKRDA